MGETYEMSTWLHLSFIKILLGLLILHIVLVFVGDTSKFSYIKRLMYFLPTYYVFLAFIFFTGVLNLAILHFSISFSVVFMIVCWIALIPFGAAGFKRLKRVRITKEFSKFKKFMIFKIVCEIILVVLATVVGVVF
ncbi:hypothetical protein Q4Y15_000580 [Campylobacter fetus]|uniref:Uncharacterized protein n=3 Tax=Campylobacter fetus TaxID=196 RepID=A0A5L4IDM1_CAMFE|nr:hypothetical protein [Campylobacter fetus]OCS22935.1 hypothetical protein CFVI97532_01430 [Campylobacter fetus subsp. venerealis cfvi97/532]OCS27131.1 hypothetical protein CFVB10_00180 [Campylobacter fetus subsp. venerealis cfvB10]OCS30236.1 hypothetical protein CFVCCUG33900_01725 [Campylobacter fetus subsp. venerealis LMG 6570 = CCUG 33900]OCS42669.1 hypothetical protein CFVI02298_03710 [Campylobacter fetus subsp. venerealis cfvi02/298]ABK83250.1 hypothetical protein CFF8240_0226 [Campylob